MPGLLERLQGEIKMYNAWEAFELWWKNHTLFSLFITGTSVPGAIAKYSEGGMKAFGWLQRKHVGAKNEPLQRSLNERFGITFYYPRNWEKTSAHSNDGSTIRCPHDDKIEVRVWGCYAIIPDSYDEWMKKSLEHATKIISKTEITIPAYLEKDGSSRLDGYRIEYQTGRWFNKINVIQTFFELSGIRRTVRCQCRSIHYKYYMELFLDICHQFAISEVCAGQLVNKESDVIRFERSE